MKKALLLLTMLCLMGPTSTHSNPIDLDKPVKKLAYRSLKKALIHSIDLYMRGDIEDAITNPNGLIALLGLTDSNEARELLLELAEVHIGEVQGEALTYAILKQGNAMKYGLKSMMKKSCECALIKKGSYAKKINRIKCITRKIRDYRITYYLEMIDKGETTELIF